LFYDFIYKLVTPIPMPIIIPPTIGKHISTKHRIESSIKNNPIQLNFILTDFIDKITDTIELTNMKKSEETNITPIKPIFDTARR